MHRSPVSLCCLTFLSILNFLVFKPVFGEDNQKGLAKVAILTFEDQTGTKNFGYMPNSLTEAIDKSLQQRFEYVRESPQKSAENRKAIKASGVLNAREAAQYCVKNDVQILIFGKFNFDPQSKQIVVETYISLGVEDQFRTLDERRNATDASIFILADKVADDIINKMTEIAQEQANKRKSEKKRHGEKIELEKIVPVVWAFKNYNANLGLGITVPNSDLATSYTATGALTFSANRLIWKGLYGGAFAQLFQLSPKDGSGRSTWSSLTVLPATLNVGYSLFFGRDRWRINGEVGGGYYNAKFEVKDSSAGSETVIYTRTFSNPVVRTAVSLQWLLLQSMSLGVEYSYLWLLDKGERPGRASSFMLTVGYVF